MLGALQLYLAWTQEGTNNTQKTSLTLDFVVLQKNLFRASVWFTGSAVLSPMGSLDGLSSPRGHPINLQRNQWQLTRCHFPTHRHTCHHLVTPCPCLFTPAPLLFRNQRKNRNKCNRDQKAETSWEAALKQHNCLSWPPRLSLLTFQHSLCCQYTKTQQAKQSWPLKSHL